MKGAVPAVFTFYGTQCLLHTLVTQIRVQCLLQTLPAESPFCKPSLQGAVTYACTLLQWLLWATLGGLSVYSP